MSLARTALRDLRNLFDRRIGAREIAVPLVSFDEDADVRSVIGFMQSRRFDVVGVRTHGLCRGYFAMNADAVGTLQAHASAFDAQLVVDEDAPLPTVVARLRERSHLYVRALGEVVALVSRADLHRPAVRMWLFSLCSLTEIQMLRLVREAWPGDTWRQHLGDARLEKAEALFAQRRARGEELGLVDCLQMADKRDLLLTSSDLVSRLGYESKKRLKRELKSVEQVRDLVAHSQSLDHDEWRDFFDGIAAAERFLDAAEGVVESPPHHPPTAPAHPPP